MRVPALYVGALALMLSLFAAATAHAETPRRPDFNAVATAPPTIPPSAVAQELLDPGKPLHRDTSFGVPTFLWANPKGAQVPATARSGNGRERAVRAARAHLDRYAGAYGLSAATSAALEVRDVQILAGGPAVVRFNQRFDGIEVFRQHVNVLMDSKLALKAISGHPSAHVASLRSKPFLVSSTDAIASALTEMTEKTVHGAALQVHSTQGEYTRYTLMHPSVQLSEPARARRVWFDLPKGIESAWYVETSVAGAPPAASYYAYVFSALDGRLLFRRNLTDQAAYSYRAWVNPADGQVQKNPYGNVGVPHPTGVPDGYQAPFVAPSLATLDYLPGFSKRDPWLPAGATVTTGNNVDAYADTDGINGFSGSDFRAPLSGSASFDWMYDVTQLPLARNSQKYGAITSLFYINNYLHDLFYDHGFDEVAGNAQDSNYGRGGFEGDGISAETINSGRDNAFMHTPADGGRPRMEMYAWLDPTLTFNPAVVTQSRLGLATFGPRTYSVTAEITGALDATGGYTLCGPPVVNLAGYIALVERGTCNFTVKVKYAQNAGAVGVLVVNNVEGVVDMNGDDASITIPSAMITRLDAETLVLAMFDQPVQARLESGVDREGSLDTTVVAHEWGHYMVSRLTEGFTNNQGDALAEGWADFVALLTTVQEADRSLPGNASFNGVYAIGSYVSHRLANGDNFYFGVRRYPYSTNLSKNPLTFRHISSTATLPAGVPANITEANNAEIHNAGEVWAVALWEVYAALLNDPRYTFTQARARMLDYTVAHLKLVPTDATFTEARDAMLAVAQATDTGDFVLMLNAFAKRGLALTAVAPARESTDHAGVVESFDINSKYARASTPRLNFLVAVDTQHTQQVRIANWGNQPLNLTAISVNGSGYQLGGTCSAGTSLAAGTSCTIDVTFAPLTHGLHPGQVVVENDGMGGAVAVDLDGEATSGSYQLVSQPSAVSIPEEGLVSSTLVVSGVTAQVLRVELILDGLSHAFPSDLTVTLTGPRGQGVLIMSEAGGGRPGVSNAQLRFAADVTDGVSTPLTSGLFLPAGDLGVFNGLDPNGVWRLDVKDAWAPDGGSIKSWHLLFTLADAQPRPFSFASVETTNLGSLVESQSAMIRDITIATPVTVTGGEYSVNSGAYTATSGFVNEGDQVRLRATAPTTWGSSVSATLTVGGYGASFVVTTPTMTDHANKPPSAPILVSPGDKQSNVVSPVVFKWEGSSDPEGDKVAYELYVCTNDNFSGCTGTVVAARAVAVPLIAAIGSFGAFAFVGGFSLNRPGQRRKRILVVMAVAFGLLGALSACSGGGSGNGGGQGTPTLLESPATPLVAATTYYWKVVAIDSKGNSTPSGVWSFTTK